MRTKGLEAGEWGARLPARGAPAVALPGGATARLVAHGAYEAEVPACRDALVALRLAGVLAAARRLEAPHGGEDHGDEDEGWRGATTRPGSLTLLPAGRASAWRLDGPGLVLHLHLPAPEGDAPAFAATSDTATFGRPCPLDPAALGARDARLGALLRALALALRAGALPRAGALAAAAARRLAGAPDPAAGPGAALPPDLAALIAAHVEAHLAGPVAVGDLAALAGLAPSRFAERFRATFGLPPHAHVTRRRMVAARALLAGAGPPLVEVALAVGFAHQAHFTAAFARHHGGLTPGAYRDRVCRARGGAG